MGFLGAVVASKKELSSVSHDKKFALRGLYHKLIRSAKNVYLLDSKWLFSYDSNSSSKSKDRNPPMIGQA